MRRTGLDLNRMNGLSHLISALSQLLVCRQASVLNTGINLAMDHYISALGADEGYFYLLDDLQKDRLVCRHHRKHRDAGEELPDELSTESMDSVLNWLHKDNMLELTPGDRGHKRDLFKTDSGFGSPDVTYLFIQSRTHQDMLGLLVLCYGPGSSCPEISETDDLLSSLQVLTNVVVHHNIIFENESRYRFEKILREISKQMINPSPDQIDSCINKGLKAITEFFDVDRGIIFQRTPKKPIAILTHAYSRLSPNKLPANLNITEADYPYLSHEHIVKRRITFWNSINDLPKQARKDWENLNKWGVKSSLNIPLTAGDHTYGTLTFNTVKKETRWPREIIGRATVIGEIFTNALARKYADEALQNSLNEIKKLKDQLESENTYLQKEIKLSHNFDEIVGDSCALKTVLLKITQCAPTDAAVMISGETGTGKELVARAVHDKSRRNKRPMIKVDCGSLPATLIERELFGHKKGAFTGAHQQQMGRFEIANGGTLFLDEIGELPLELQSKLLRVLQDGEFERLGDPKTCKVDVRIIAATNRDLEKEIQEGRFRSDLWYRLNVFPIIIPPLRERKKDIPKLVHWFVNKHARKMGKRITKISEETLTSLSNRYWAGNIRELENTIQRALIISTHDRLELFDDRPSPQAEAAPSPLKTLESVERKHIQAVLEQTNGRIYGPKGAAVILDLNPSTLRFRIKKLGILKNIK